MLVNWGASTTHTNGRLIQPDAFSTQFRELWLPESSRYAACCVTGLRRNGRVLEIFTRRSKAVSFRFCRCSICHTHGVD